MTKTLSLTERQHQALRDMLFPGDGLESAAILICRYVGPQSERLIVADIINVPDNSCLVRKVDYISWPGASVEEAIDKAEDHGDAIILIHSHPGGWLNFSETDDESDRAAMPGLFAAIEGNAFHHGSAIMTPDGAMRARLYDRAGEASKILHVWRVGQNIVDLAAKNSEPVMPFGSGMAESFARQAACIIGISGTGSIVAELLARKGVGHLILIDFDRVEQKNLNRIVNSTVSDANGKRLKTEMMAEAIASYAPRTKVTVVNCSIEDREAVIAASAAEVLFCCVDSMAGRSIAELIAQCCIIPLIDMGVTIPTRLDADGHIKIADVCGRIDYVRPDGPNLTDRGVVTADGLRREYLIANAPEVAKREIEAGYIKGVHEEAPSVMALNMRVASEAVLEWLERQFPYRLDGSDGFSRTLFSHAAGEVEFSSDSDFKQAPTNDVGRGLIEPLLGLPALAKQRRKDAA